MNTETTHKRIAIKFWVLFVAVIAVLAVMAFGGSAVAGASAGHGAKAHASATKSPKNFSKPSGHAGPGQNLKIF